MQRTLRRTLKQLAQKSLLSQPSVQQSLRQWIKRSRFAAALGVVITSAGFATLVAVSACHDITVGAGQAASVSLDTIPYPSIVAGDSLRDSSGVARPIKGTAYDNNGRPLAGFLLKYRVLDSGIKLDSLTGYAVGDTARSNAIRILVDAAGLQTTPSQLFVVPRPDTVFADSAIDTLKYSLFDTSAVTSTGLSITVGHKVTAIIDSLGYIPVQAYLVSYRMIYPTDTSLVRFVDAAGHATRVDAAGHPTQVDTTGVDGRAHPQIRFQPLAIKDTLHLRDSVVLFATVRYRGVPITDSIRLVVQVRPNQ